MPVRNAAENFQELFLVVVHYFSLTRTRD
jgi:hypothetical protein